MKSLKKVVIDKVQTLAVLLYILGLFLLDVNANIIASKGLNTTVPVINGSLVTSESMFWLGFLVLSICFFIVSIRSLYKRTSRQVLDVIFGLLGVIGWGIILSGVLLIFAGADGFMIPMFGRLVERITYYHIGIGLSIISIFYFALTK